MATTVSYSWANVTPSFFVNNTFTAGNQNGPALAFIGSGYLTAWNDTSPTNAVEARLIGSDGVPTGGEFLANTTTVNSQFDPALASNGSSSLLTFTDFSVDPGGDIRGRLFGANGAPSGNDFIINSDLNDDVRSDVAALAGGGYVAAWTRQFGAGDNDIRAQIINPDGTLQGGFITVDSSSLNTDNASVAGLAGGGFVVAYEQSPAAGGNTSVYFRLYAASGTPVAASHLIDGIGSINHDIQVKALADGGFAVAYTDDGWGISGTEITLKLFNADGTDRTGYIRANTNTSGDQNLPSITTLSNGYIVVGWNDGTSLHEQAFTPSGVLVGPDYVPTVSVVEAEIAGLSGGLLANIRSSTVMDAGGDNSIRSSIDELTRTTTGDNTGESLNGDSLRDIMNGGGGNDTIDGGLGNDTLTGGTGSDTFVFYYAGTPNHDNITDFVTGSGGDKLLMTAPTVYTAAAYLAFAHQVGSDTVFDTGGGNVLTVQGVMKSNLVYDNIPFAEAQARDFGGDLASDILLRNNDGSVAVWQMEGASIASASVVVNPGASWHAIGTGDTDGDGRSDIILQNTNGSVAVWKMNGESISSGTVLANPGPAWHAVAVADFDHDLKADILLRNDDGNVAIWHMNGSAIASGDIIVNPGATWHIVGTGDFRNHDGKSDIAFQNDDGSVALWAMNGSTIDEGVVLANPGPAWHVKGSGDFNGDGYGDLALQNNDGSVAIWNIVQSGIASAAIIANPGPDWHLVDVADFDKDGKSDLLFQRDDGSVAEWHMDGLTLVSGTVVVNPGADWHVTHNFDLI